MSRFHVDANADPASRRDAPCWLDVQGALIHVAESRAVAPLSVPGQAGPLRGRPVPSLSIAGKTIVTRAMVTDIAQATNAPMQTMGGQSAGPADDRQRITDAPDSPIHGI